MKKTAILLIFIGCSGLATASAEDDSSYPQLTYDLSAGTGTNGSASYSEANLGLNLHLSSWANWRNAIFGRFSTTTTYGLDTGFRADATVGPGKSLSLNAFAGAGYRFVTQGSSAPFAETGLNIALGGLRLGGGAKVVFNSVVQPGAANDTIYSLTIAGSGRL